MTLFLSSASCVSRYVSEKSFPASAQFSFLMSVMMICTASGVQPSAADTAKIKAPLLIHYAANDERINAGWPAYEAALKANGVRHEAHFYPGTEHGFHNDTTPRYDEAAAKLAWSRTVAWFNKYLR